MSKLSFRARPLEASKPMPIFMSEELPDLPEYSAINRAVPQMPSGMKKEEECEHHLQRAMVTGLIIPTPEVIITPDKVAFDRLYPPNFKVSRQLIHMQPFTMEQDIPDYDLDSEDEKWLSVQKKNMDINEFKFEEMMDRLEKNSGHSVVTQSEAKVLLKEDDDLIIAVYDYWLNKRLRTQQSLIPCVKTETHRGGNNNNNPYLAFRRRTEKMQTRKNRKNDESTYEKMVKLKRDLSRAVTLLELVKRRENSKRELLHLTVEVFEKRYQAQDFSGTLLAEVSAMKTSRPAFAPLFTNQFNHTTTWAKPVKTPIKDDYAPRKEKRQYKKRKHKSNLLVNDVACVPSSGEDDTAAASPTSPEKEEPPFAFRRKRQCLYHAPVSSGLGNWPWCSKEEGGTADQRFRFNLTSLATPSARCIGMARRRVGRGGRVILDRVGPAMDDFWASLDFTIHDNSTVSEKRDVDADNQTPADDILTVDDLSLSNVESFQDWPHFRPKTPPMKVDTEEEEPFNILQNSSLSLMVEDLAEPSSDPASVQLNLSELFPQLSWESVCEETARRDEFDVITLPSESEVERERESQLHKRPSIDKREYQTGSLLDRWARFESPPPEPVKVTKPRVLEVIIADQPIGCSAFRTKDLWRDVKCDTAVESSTSVVALKEVQKESSTVIVEDSPMMPPTPPKETKTPPPATILRANNISAVLNGPLAANNRHVSKHLGYNSSYRKRNNHLHNHGMHNKLIMRIPDNTNELHDPAVGNSQVMTEKSQNEALLRKSTQLAMEVT